jgi:hypothetical protein
MLLMMMTRGTDAIYDQEADGQRSLVNSDTLPSEMSSEARQVLEQAGVVFGELVEGDPLFIYVTLPPGWTKQGTSHSMHSNLLDDKGRVRANMFYKAAFYDRRADLNLTRRYNTGRDYDREDVIIMFVTDSGERIFTGQEYSFSGEKYGDDYRAQEQVASTEINAWLMEHFPDWKSTAAYWD